MIDSKTLMRGNIIQFNDDDSFAIVKGIDADELGLTVYFPKTQEETWIEAEHFHAVKLSSELLSKIEGFSKYENKFHIGINYGHFIVYPVGDIYDHWYLYREETRITSGIRYLHQLQNLYFCLSGNELKLKL